MKEAELMSLVLRLRARHAVLIAAGTFVALRVLRTGQWLLYGNGRWLWWTPKNITLPPLVPVSRLDSFRHISIQRQFPLYVSFASCSVCWLRDGEAVFLQQYEYFKKYGPIIRIPLFHIAPWVYVSDPAVAKLITEGDRSLELDESPKAAWLYALFSSFTGGPNMFSKPITTQGSITGCLASRKAVASAFSMANIDALIPHLNTYMESLGGVLDRMASSERSFDVCEFFLRLSLDFTCGSMFDFHINSMKEFEAVREMGQCGAALLTCHVSAGVKTIVNEISVMRVINPLRKYMYWADHQKKFDQSGFFLRQLGRVRWRRWFIEKSDSRMYAGHFKQVPEVSQRRGAGKGQFDLR
eukprot:753299-Hanusia_phi.AAC.8